MSGDWSDTSSRLQKPINNQTLNLNSHGFGFARSYRDEVSSSGFLQRDRH